MQKKNEIKRAVLSGAATLSKKTSGFIANLPCTWWNYQPKMPKSVKKMRKF